MLETILPHDDVGVGEPLVMLHAFPLDSRMWEPQRAALSARCRLVTPDFAGFGRARNLSPRTSLDADADDVVALLDALGLPKVTLLGLSMGGYVALAFARRYPERLAALVLADTRAGDDSVDAKAGRNRSIAQVEKDGMPAFVEPLLSRLLSERATSDVKERVRRIAVDQPPAAVIAALGAMRDRGDETPVLRAIAVPVLVLVGSLDALTPPDVSERMARLNARSSLVVLEGAGHLSNQEAAETFNTALLGWLDRHDLA